MTNNAVRVRTATGWQDIALQGPPGPPGPTGAPGGVAGPGIAAGGSTGQFLTKASATDYATQWTTPPRPITLAQQLDQEVYVTPNTGETKLAPLSTLATWISRSDGTNPDFTISADTITFRNAGIYQLSLIFYAIENLLAGVTATVHACQTTGTTPTTSDPHATVTAASPPARPAVTLTAPLTATAANTRLAVYASHSTGGAKQLAVANLSLHRISEHY